jgi:hypothetical protein
MLGESITLGITSYPDMGNKSQLLLDKSNGYSALLTSNLSEVFESVQGTLITKCNPDRTSASPTALPAFFVRTWHQKTPLMIFAIFPPLSDENPCRDFWAPGFYI